MTSMSSKGLEQSLGCKMDYIERSNHLKVPAQFLTSARLSEPICLSSVKTDNQSALKGPEVLINFCGTISIKHYNFAN